MLSAWLLPEHIADVLPMQAQRVETLRRALIDRTRSYGFELVIPPLLEHLDSLLSGTGRALEMQTFKLVDQLSGRLLGLRADTTAQAARIDAHLLNREGVTRLCYCGPVLHTVPTGTSGTREPLQFGAEIFGHAGLEADLEAAELAIDCLQAADPGPLVVDLADARLLRGVLAGIPIDSQGLQDLVQALAEKDTIALETLSAEAPDETRRALRSLMRLYGDDSVLDRAARELPDRLLVRDSIAQLRWLAAQLRATFPGITVGFDLADMSGYAYYSGPRFAVYVAGHSDALARGGRYDEVGSVFGRNRPAVGFSLDLKALAELAPQASASTAIRAPWSADPSLRAQIRQLRERGERVLALPATAGLPGEDHMDCDRELVQLDGRWQVVRVQTGGAVGAGGEADGPNGRALVGEAA
ncbi:MAG: ATP phosphoribosyltransferase regulatory subunit [Rubrivivax sp.]